MPDGLKVPSAPLRFLAVAVPDLLRPQNHCQLCCSSTLSTLLPRVMLAACIVMFA